MHLLSWMGSSIVQKRRLCHCGLFDKAECSACICLCGPYSFLGQSLCYVV